jgi:RNA-directed DNA polymerase
MGRLNKSTTQNINYMSISERKSTIEAWESISWELVEYRVHRVQRRIYKASFLGNQEQLFWLQNKLIRSPDAQVLAVRLVTRLYKHLYINRTSKLSDMSDQQKLKISRQLQLDGSAISNLELFIQPKYKKTHLIDLQFIIDKAKQVLVKFVLEPEWEARFEENSYGGRSGRSIHDAIEEIFVSMSNKSNNYIAEYDIKTVIDKIQPIFIIQKLNTFSQMNKQIQAWLNSSILTEYMLLLDSNLEIPQLINLKHVSILAPLLINVLLCDLKEYIYTLYRISNNIYNFQHNQVSIKKPFSFIRDTHKFILIHENPLQMRFIMAQTYKWLLLTGVPISRNNFRFSKGTEGFTFGGFQVIQIKQLDKYKIKITPSRIERINLLLKVRTILQKNKSASAFNLICFLRPVILGWANYFRHCECKDIFDKMSYQIFGQLRAWVFRRDTRNGRSIVKENYFPSHNMYTYEGKLRKDRWVLFGSTKDLNGKVRTNHLPKISWVARLPYIKIKANYSPYNGDHIYWSKRDTNYPGIPISLQTLLVKQNHLCAKCNKSFLTSTEFEIAHINPTQSLGREDVFNLQVLHHTCHTNRTVIQIPQNNEP